MNGATPRPAYLGARVALAEAPDRLEEECRSIIILEGTAGLQGNTGFEGRE